MNQKDQTNEYNIVIDTLQKKLDALEEMQRGCDNIRRSVGGGVGMMDSIRYEQIDELSKAIKREQALAALAEPTERVPLVRLTDEKVDEILEEWPDFTWMKPFANAIMDAMDRVNGGSL